MPAGPAAPAPHNVPPALSSFVGRIHERTELARTLGLAGDATRRARLVTVTGPGGGGKTRLAREVAAAAAAAPAYPAGVWWVELAPVAAGAPDVAPAVAAALGVHPTPGRDVADAVAEALRGPGGPSLLVLDNCEHVVEGAAALAERLLRGAPSLTILATSREALAVEGEQVWVLPPLASPPPAAPTAAAVGEYEAVRLFVERAQAASPGFALTDRTAPAVAAVVARLDGLPLALELAAASVGALGVEQVAARLGDVFALLTRGRRTALPRHRTLRATLDWSFALLRPAERALLARLAVFRGPFTLEAAEAVGGELPGGAAGGRPSVLDALGRLVEQSLVEGVEREDGTRFRLLETVRQYGLARLAEDPAGAASARARHAGWVVALAEGAEPSTWTAARGPTVRRLEREADEIRAALDWATGPDAGAAGPMTAVRIAAALAWFWFSGVPWGEARSLTARALAAADAQGIDDADRPPADQAAIAALCYPTAGLSWFAGEPDGMLVLTARAVALWDRVRASGDPSLRRALVRGRAIIRQVAGLAHAMRGEAAEALAALDDAVATARDGGERWLHAVMLMRRALVCAAVGRLDDSIADYERSLPLLRAVHESWFLSLALEGMAEVELARGALAVAAAHARESVAVLADEPDAWFVSRSLDALASIAVAPAAPRTPDRGAVAARLMGAAAGLRARCGAEVLGVDRARHEATVAAARAAAGGAAYDAAWASGETLDLAGAVALASTADVVDGTAHDAARGGAPAVVPHETEPPDVPGALPSLAVEALGPLVVARDGRPLAGGELPGGKVTELLLHLVCHPEGRTKDEIGLALWPDASAAQVRGSFHVTLHRLRTALGAGPERPWITAAGGRYALARRPDGMRLTCDVDDVLAAADALARAERRRRPLDADALAGAERALGAARGELAQGLALGDWVVAHQDRVRAAWADGVQALARQHAGAGRHAEAARLLAALVAREPLREAAHRELMVTYAALGEPARALAHYDALAELLRREVGAAPSRETQRVAERIRGGAAVA